MAMIHIIMVCSGNICRSPMAAALLRHLLPPHIKASVSVSSAGTHAMHGNHATERAVEVMAQLGIDLSNHRARQLTRNHIRQADLTLVMERVHLEIIKHTLWWGKSRVHLLTKFDPHSGEPDIQDPYGAPLEAYQACAQIIRPCVEGVIQWLVKEIDKS